MGAARKSSVGMEFNKLFAKRRVFVMAERRVVGTAGKRVPMQSTMVPFSFTAHSAA